MQCHFSSKKERTYKNLHLLLRVPGFWWTRERARCTIFLKMSTESRHYKSSFINNDCTNVLSHFSHVRFFMTLWTAACQAPLSMGLFKQEYWSGLSCPPPGDLPSPGIKLMSLMSPALAGGFFTTSTTFLRKIILERLLIWEIPLLT